MAADGDCSHEINRCLLLERKVMSNLNSILKSRDITCQLRSIRSKLWFFQYHIWMWQLNHIEGWVPKNWCFFFFFELMLLNCGVGEDSWESVDYKDIQPAHSKRDQSSVFIGRIDVEDETPILRPPDVKCWLIWKDPDVGNDWGQEEKGTKGDEIVRWHHQLNGHESG